MLAMPGFPGAACSSVSSSAWLSLQASACSRPPEPTSNTFTGGTLTSRVGGFERARGRAGWGGCWSQDSIATSGRANGRPEEELADSPADALPGLVDRERIGDFPAAREIPPPPPEGRRGVFPGDVR